MKQRDDRHIRGTHMHSIHTPTPGTTIVLVIFEFIRIRSGSLMLEIAKYLFGWCAIDIDDVRRFRVSISPAK